MKTAIVFLLSTVVLVSASRYETSWNDYRPQRRNIPKGAMDCLNAGGVNKDDLSNLLDDVISNNLKNLTSVKNLCIATCLIHDRITPAMKATFLQTAFGEKIHTCIKGSDGVGVCESAKGLVSCMGSQLIKDLWPIISNIMN